MLPLLLLFFFVVVAVGADVVGEGGKLLLTESNVDEGVGLRNWKMMRIVWPRVRTAMTRAL